MLLSINYSNQAANLYKNGRINIDRFKCPDWPEMIKEAQELLPVAVHFDLKAGRDKLQEVDWDKIYRLMEKTETPYVNLHLEAKSKDFPHIPVDTTKITHQEEIYTQVFADICTVRKHFDTSQIIIENVPFRGKRGNVLRPVVEPQFIKRVLEETGCGLLLDLSHAKISAMTMGMDDFEYFCQLPMNQLKELHFTGVHNRNGWLQDHLSVLENDWRLLDWVVENIQNSIWSEPWMLAFEYGGVGERFKDRSDPQVMHEQIPMINKRISVI
jgi:uncharacterized protein (UPF0276 family)